MLKVVAILVVLCGICAGYAAPPYNAYMYYRQPMGQQQMMYGFQYQNLQLRNRQHSLTGMSAFAAGPSFRNARSGRQEELPAQDDLNVESAAEEFPAEQFPVDDEPQNDLPAVEDQEAEEPIADEPIPAAASNVPSVVTEKKKKKKMTVQMDSDEDDTPAGAAPNAYFPINFGDSNGGAIAVANSYSTGKGGSAMSTSYAYGSAPVDQLRRAAPVAGQLRRRPAKKY